MPVCANDNLNVYTVGEWLFGCVNFAVPESAVDYVCNTRAVDPDVPYAQQLAAASVPAAITVPAASPAGNTDVHPLLLKADLIRWIVLGPGKVNSTSDSDNGWSHSEGGYTLSEADKKLLIDEANAIYEELEPQSVITRTRIRMRSAGIMPAYRDTDGTPLPRRPI